MLSIADLVNLLRTDMNILGPLWFPGGKHIGKKEYVVRNPDRQDQSVGSFSICLDRGFGYDFSSKKWYGPIDLFAISHGMSTQEAIWKLRGSPAHQSTSTQRAMISHEQSQCRMNHPEKPMIFPSKAFDTKRLWHHVFGKPDAVFTYKAANCALIGYVCRFNILIDSIPVKRVLPFTFSIRNGKAGWHWSEEGWAGVKPIYRAEKLGSNLLTPILITEGEATCEAAQRLFPEVICISWRGGAHSAGKVDWSSLLPRRHITIWPDRDNAGIDAARIIKATISKAAIVQPPMWKEKGWDLGDAEREGASTKALQKYWLENQIR